jgi:hypothetical protein
MYDSVICYSCADAAEDARRILHDTSLSCHLLNIYELADMSFEAKYEVSMHNRERLRSGKAVLTPEEYVNRYCKNIYELAKSDKYNCPVYSTIKCGFCGELGIDVEYLGTERDSDGTFENWRASCPHCGKTSVDMDDPTSAIDIIVHKEQGEIVDVD